MPKAKKEVKWTEKRSWKAFKDSGMLWLANRTLHLFGWAICVEVNKKGKIKGAYPARCRFRGFDYKTDANGFSKATRYMVKKAKSLLEDTKL